MPAWTDFDCQLGALFQRSREQVRRFPPESAGDLDELDHINAPFSDLDLCDEGLRTLQPARQLVLTDSGALAGLHERRTKDPVSTGSQGLQCRAPQGWIEYI